MKKTCRLCCFIFVQSIFCSSTGPSSEPYLSGDTWRHHVDHILADVEVFLPEKVCAGDTIFVEQDSLSQFHSDYMPRIQYPYILITANCDQGGDDPMPGKHEKILDDPLLVMWFTQNIDRIGHPKLYPIPIGLANQKYPHGRVETYNAMIPQSKLQIRDQWVYMNFSIWTNRSVRQPCWSYFSRFPSIVSISAEKPHDVFLQELARSVFVISPPGHGFDCHRTWEALLLGCYPIVLSSTLDPLYEDLPVVIVQRWDEVTPAFLSNKYHAFKNEKWNFEKLYFRYWFSKVEAIQDAIRQNNRSKI